VSQPTTIDGPRLTDAAYWDGRRPNAVARIHPDGHLERYLRNVLPVNPEWSCLEVGVVPGSILLWMAKRFKYRVTGVDLSPEVNNLSDAFRERGADATFVEADFLRWRPRRRFEVVFSCGFVEHFRNYREVIRRHWDLVTPGGTMVLSVPSWSPVQRMIRKAVYTKSQYRKITGSHNLAVMNLPALREAVERCPGARVVVVRHILEMKVWIRPGQPGTRRWTAPLFLPIRLFERLFRVLRLSSPLFSPSVLVVARKERNESAYPG
jgi:SAM-dependent methyltransferase